MTWQRVCMFTPLPLDYSLSAHVACPSMFGGRTKQCTDGYCQWRRCHWALKRPEQIGKYITTAPGLSCLQNCQMCPAQLKGNTPVLLLKPQLCFAHVFISTLLSRIFHLSLISSVTSRALRTSTDCLQMSEVSCG